MRKLRPMKWSDLPQDTHVCSEIEPWASPSSPDPCHSHLFKCPIGWLCACKSPCPHSPLVCRLTAGQLLLTVNLQMFRVWGGGQCRGTCEGRRWQPEIYFLLFYFIKFILIQWALSWRMHITLNFAVLQRGFISTPKANPALGNGRTLSKLIESERTSTKC